MSSLTPLHDWHVSHRARMVDFAGWNMPIQYSSISDEHQAVRTAAGLFDISHMGRLSFEGPDCLPLIQKVFSNDAATLKFGQVRYGLICNSSGGIRDDVLVYRWPHGFSMVVNASNRTKIVNWLAEHGRNFSVNVADQTEQTCMVAVQGPRSIEISQDLTAADASHLPYYFATSTEYRGKPCVISRTGYTGEDGLEIIAEASQALELWNDLVQRGAKPCGLGARDTLRLEAAMPLYGHELTEEIDPFQAGLSWAVKLDKGEFIGRESFLKRNQDLSLPQRVGWEIEGRGIAREGSRIFHENKEKGKVTSGTFTPYLNKAIAMGYLDRRLSLPGTRCQVEIRGKMAEAIVVALPFYRRSRK